MQAQIMPVELVVNVDHPSDIATWAQLSYNTSGMVVPVLRCVWGVGV